MTDRKRKRPNNAQPAAASSQQHHSFDLVQFLPPAPDAPIVSRVNRVSSDNRRVYTEAVPVAPPSPVKCLRADAQRPSDAPPHLPLLDESERYGMETFDDEDDGGDENIGGAASTGAPRPADPAMNVWMREHRDDFLRVLLWRDGRGAGTVSTSSVCLCGPAGFRSNWATKTIRCARVLARHAGDFVMLHHNGIHEVSVAFCGCYHSKDVDHLQLLKAGYYPATLDAPRTCATFSCLDLFQNLSLHGKATAYDFYATLETLTNAVGIKPPDRYRVFLRVARQWRHLHLLKRAGRGHDKYGVVGTGPGELAIRCPACPRPGVNLPEDWADASPEDSTGGIRHGGNRGHRHGGGSRAGYQHGNPHLMSSAWFLHGCQRQLMSLCSGLAALDHANDKFSRGFAATGVAMGICARHEFVLPTAVADLQKGERYANIDYVFMAFLRHLLGLLWIIVYYDIACQWSKNLKERLAALPPLVRLQAIQALLTAMRFAIPKMHVKGHILACQMLFAFWLIRGSGQVDGEGIERTWSSLGGVAASTRVSGPGSRADQLDDHLGFWNWMKLIRIASLLRRRLDKARSELAKQETELRDFSEHQKEDVEKWKADVDAFEADPSQPNPYAVEVVRMTEREVRNRFEEEEAAAKAAGRVRLHEFLELVLRVEEDQRRVHSLASLKRAKTTAVKINLRRHRRRLNKAIARIRGLQATYMPAALTCLNELKISSETPAELVPILAPSTLPEAARSGNGCLDGLAELERQLRDAQCRSSLAGLRNQLHVKARFLVYKKILLHADKYQAARRALVALAGNTSEGLLWPTLLKDDIRCMDGEGGAFEPREGREDVFGRSASGSRAGQKARSQEGETRRIMSWIWKFTEASGTDGEIRAALKVEWSKAYARTRRWREEVRVLEEEWRRLPLSFGHEERLWVERATSVDVGGTEPALAEGLVAYATKQVEMYRGLARRAGRVQTAPALRRGQARVREVEGKDPLVVPSTEAERAEGDAVEDGGGDGAEMHPDEAIEEFVDELGNASDDEEDGESFDEDYIMDGDGYD
ncbi:CxC2 domain-containing protein [Mycena kentingensis (nom. inval.)]|nr:CxC2 domain-containing protein [Mycena kentingensis (nom. inval.)]